MNEFFTIYFDTQFYVKLANANETLASKTIDALNNLQVRIVLSQPIILELLKKASKPDKDKILVERINRFNIPSYIAKPQISETESSLSWNVLLLEGKEREFLSNSLIFLKDLQTEAESATIAIPRNSQQEEKLLDSSLHKLEEFGVLENKDKLKNNEIDEVLKTSSNILNQLIFPLADILPTEMISKIKEIDFDREGSIENATNIAQQLFDAIGIENREWLQSHQELKGSITKNEDRPFKVSVGEASKGEIMKLGNTLGDTEHMILFAINKNEIDLLQIDIPQSKILKNNPSHKLVEMGLHGRCFTATSLEEIVQKVTELKKTFQK